MRRVWPSLLAFCLVATACSGDRPTFDDSAAREVEPLDEASAPTDAVSVRLALPDGFSMDPVDAGPASVANRVVADLLYERLVRVEDGTAVPALADRWFVDEARTTWTFVLGSDLADNDGEPLTARDMKLSLERVAAAGPANQHALALTTITGWSAHMAGTTGGVAGLSAPDDTTLVVRLDEPFEPLLDVLADPAFGITGLGDDGLLRTTGPYARGEDPSRLEAVGTESRVAEVELVTDADGPLAVMAAGAADWAVIDTGAPSDGLDADIIRLPLELELAMVSRLDDEDERLGVMSALEPLLLAGAVGGLTARATAVPTSAGEPPEAVLVDIPAGDLEDIGVAVADQLVAAGIEAAAIPSERAVFATRVADGDAVMFPVVIADGLSGLLQLAAPGATDDVFGPESAARSELATAVRAEFDPEQRALFVSALERALIEDGLLLPIGRYEVRVAIGSRLDGLRHRADGTLDLSRVELAG
ncbi:MAG: ABC transporter substrate-binding protein [Actinomycetota bacterium]